MILIIVTACTNQEKTEIKEFLEEVNETIDKITCNLPYERKGNSCCLYEDGTFKCISGKPFSGIKIEKIRVSPKGAINSTEELKVYLDIRNYGEKRKDIQIMMDLPYSEKKLIKSISSMEINESKTIKFQKEVFNLTKENKQQGDYEVIINVLYDEKKIQGSFKINVSDPFKTHIVELQRAGEGMQFFPKEIKINSGDTVRWINKIDYLNKQARASVFARHNQLFKSKMLVYGESFEYTFISKGSYMYGATPYEYLFEVGTVIVK